MAIKISVADGLEGLGTLLHLGTSEISTTGLSGTSTITLVSAVYENPILNLIGTGTGTINIVVPNTVGGTFTINNNTTADALINVKTSSGTAVVVHRGINVFTITETNVIRNSRRTSYTQAIGDVATFTITSENLNNVSFLKITATTLGQECTFTVPKYLGSVSIFNTTTQAIYFKTSGGTIIPVIPSGEGRTFFIGDEVYG